jgi:hypothetical protein
MTTLSSVKVDLDRLGGLRTVATGDLESMGIISISCSMVVVYGQRPSLSPV